MKILVKTEGKVYEVFASRYWKCKSCERILRGLYNMPFPRPEFKCVCGKTNWIRASEKEYIQSIGKKW